MRLARRPSMRVAWRMRRRGLPRGDFQYTSIDTYALLHNFGHWSIGSVNGIREMSKGERRPNRAWGAFFRAMLLCGPVFAAFSCILFSSGPAVAKEARVRTLLILDSQEGNPYKAARESLLDALARSGYREGKNLRVTVRFSGNNIREGESILKEELRNSYDVVYVGGTAAAISARNLLYGRAQPVVFGSVTDPVGIGVIKGFSARPAANFTGVCYPVPVKTRLKFARRLFPKARTFGLIHAEMPQSRSYNKWLENLLKNDSEFSDFRIIFRSVPLVTGPSGVRAMAEKSRRHIRELDTVVDAYISANDQLGANIHFSEAVYGMAKKPLLGLEKDDVMGGWGAFAAIYPSGETVGNQVARMIKRLFEGGVVGEILPEWPQKYGVAVDLRKARRFGVDVPVEVLQMAGENIVH